MRVFVMKLPILVACALLAAPAASHAHKASTPEAATGSSTLPRNRILEASSIFQPHRRNYLLPITSVSSPNQVPRTPAHAPHSHDEMLRREEVKFQLSFRLPLLTGVLDGPNRLWFGYTQLAFWQLYNTEESSPFREINFEPEIFLTHEMDWDLGPGSLKMMSIGFNHQSNGLQEPFSRSWNRLKTGLIYETDNWTLALEPWYRLEPSAAEDDNPDIEHYLGYGELNAIYNPSGTHALGITLFNNLQTHNNRTSVALNWSFPISGSIKAHVQYYNGYGESLIDYNERTHRIGLGFSLNDWL